MDEINIWIINVGNYEGSEMLHQSCGNNSPYLAQLAPAKYPTVNQDDVIRFSIYSLSYINSIVLLILLFKDMAYSSQF